ncbi:MAG: DUF4476 domain-containing protein [Niabella sp.]
MKTFLIALVGVFVTSVSMAQLSVESKYFVYLQTEPAQPFYVKIGGQNLSANTSGYLILPQLKDGLYKLVVGFPGDKVPEQKFNFRIDSKDKGYLIKDFGADGWGLFDLQTMAVQKPISAEDEAKLLAEEKKRKEEELETRRKQQEELLAASKRQKEIDDSIAAAKKQQEAAALAAQRQKEIDDSLIAVIDKQQKQEKQDENARAVAAKEKQEKDSLAAAKKQQEEALAAEQKRKEEDAAKKAAEAKKEPVELREDATDFTRALSKAVNDPTLLEKQKQEEKPKEKEKPVEKKESAPVAKPVEERRDVTPPAALPQAPDEVVVKESTPTKQAYSLTRVRYEDQPTGVKAVYEEKNTDGTSESVKIFVPVEKKKPEEVKVENIVPEVVVEPQPQPEKEKAKPEADGRPEKFKVEEKPAIEQAPAVPEKSEGIAPGGNCKSVASESDFLRLRRQMAGRDNDDAMINEARRAFRNRCYTTSQIKYLSSMFLSNAGKYNLYEAAYKYIADPENFSSLRDEIKDSYYQEKFDKLSGGQ